MPPRRRTDPVDLRDAAVTALVSRRGQLERIGVYLEGRHAFDLSTVVVDHAGLRAGDHLSADRQRELLEEDAPYRARERALGFLGIRDRSQREVETRLRQAGFHPEVVAETVAWLKSLDYLNDRRFAAGYAAEKQRTGWGGRRIRSELAGKGVDRCVVDEVLDTQDAEGSTAALEGADALEQMVRRRFSSQFAADPQAAERRLAGFLARRGYDWDTIGRMARTLRAEVADTESAELVEPGSSSVP
jgi:regulatory protein